MRHGADMDACVRTTAVGGRRKARNQRSRTSGVGAELRSLAASASLSPCVPTWRGYLNACTGPTARGGEREFFTEEGNRAPASKAAQSRNWGGGRSLCRNWDSNTPDPLIPRNHHGGGPQNHATFEGSSSTKNPPRSIEKPSAPSPPPPDAASIAPASPLVNKLALTSPSGPLRALAAARAAATRGHFLASMPSRSCCPLASSPRPALASSARLVSAVPWRAALLAA